MRRLGIEPRASANINSTLMVDNGRRKFYH
jgi:hypothetical protein